MTIPHVIGPSAPLAAQCDLDSDLDSCDVVHNKKRPTFWSQKKETAYFLENQEGQRFPRLQLQGWWSHMYWSKVKEETEGTITQTLPILVCSFLSFFVRWLLAYSCLINSALLLSSFTLLTRILRLPELASSLLYTYIKHNKNWSSV